MHFSLLSIALKKRLKSHNCSHHMILKSQGPIFDHCYFRGTSSKKKAQNIFFIGEKKKKTLLELLKTRQEGRWLHSLLCKTSLLLLCFVILTWGYIYIYIYRFQRAKKGDRERELSMWEKHQLVDSHMCLDWGPNIATQACALTGNWTHDLSVYRMMHQPTEPQQPGQKSLFLNKIPK